MPRPTGFEPFMRIWAVQVRYLYNAGGGVQTYLLAMRFFETEAGHAAFVARPPTGFTIVADYGEQKWKNKRSFIMAQLDDIVRHNNWIPDFDG